MMTGGTPVTMETTEIYPWKKNDGLSYDTVPNHWMLLQDHWTPRNG